MPRPRGSSVEPGIGDALVCDGSGIQVVVGAAEVEQTGAHGVSRDGAIDGFAVGPTEALIVGEEVGFSAEDFLGDDRTAGGGAEARVVEAGNGRAGGVVVERVRGPVVVEVILVNGAVPLVSAALGDHRNLRAGGRVEVGGLVGGADFEFFERVDWSRHDAGRAAAGVSGGLFGDEASGDVAGEARRVDVHAAVHVVGVLATVELEGVLIIDRASDRAVGRDAGLQGDEGGSIAADAWQSIESGAADAVTDGGVGGLQFGVGGGDFDRLGDRADFHADVDGGGDVDLHILGDDFGGAKTGASSGKRVRAGRNVAEDVLAVVVRCCAATTLVEASTRVTVAPLTAAPDGSVTTPLTSAG